MNLKEEMNVVFDVGMFDGADTSYYLEKNFRVVAVEANPLLAALAEERMQEYRRSGQLHIVNGAIGENGQAVELNVCGEDLGSSSIYASQVNGRFPIGKYTVPGVKLECLFQEHGIPFYLKIDIEGADGICVRALVKEARPKYLSFEIGADFEELIEHISAIGYTEFKIINQCSFRSLENEHSMYERVVRKLMRLAGYIEPQYVRRNGRFFKVGHSSGPVPWEADGTWISRKAIELAWAERCSTPRRNEWYDLHAR
jgi:FkbM family methyltransferase